MTRSQEVRLCLTETHSPAAQVKSQAGVPFSTGGDKQFQGACTARNQGNLGYTAWSHRKR
jgi:hypothetical protein